MRVKVASVTIDDVAARAGVSIKTVSRVMNHEPHVREGMRSKVLDAAKALDYRPSFAARALAGSRSYLIGLYFDNPSIDYVSGIQFGAMDTCRRAGFHLVVEQVDSTDPAAVGELEAFLATVRLDGVILTPPVCDQRAFLDTLDARGVRYVRIAPADDVGRSGYVRIDDRRAAHEMTRHLIDLGHRRIGFIKGHVAHSATPLRHQGFVDAMDEAGLEIAPELVLPGDFSFESGVAAAELLLRLPAPPSAVFASNDPTAVGVMTVANRLHLRLPEQLSIAGFDDSPIAQVVWPPLTTIRQPIVAMANAAAAMLVAPPGEAQRGGRQLDFEMVVRGSTAPPGTPA